MTHRDRKRRHLTVTEEPFALAETVRGRQLATVRRRKVAFVLDLVICFFVTTPFLLALAFGALYLQAPAAAKSVAALATGEIAESMDRGLAEILLLGSKRRPSAVLLVETSGTSKGHLERCCQRCSPEPLALQAALQAGL
jgi:hypothetical protein